MEHVVRCWWEGRLPQAGEGWNWAKCPSAASLDSAREGRTGTLDRAILLKGLERQYAGSGLPEPRRMEELKDPLARTVTTGHQLCLAAGPAFTCYKILTAIHLAAKLQQRWGTPVIPVFWLASEDHDFEEISSVWDGQGWVDWRPREGGGAVGRMPAAGAKQVLEEWGRRTGMPSEDLAPYASACEGSLAHAMRRWVHHLFGPDRLVVVDGDEPEWKASFSGPVVREWTDGIIHSSVVQVNECLKKAGHQPQVHVRPVNLFVLSDRQRQRVEFANGTWRSGEREWTHPQEVESWVHAHPDAVSPNALFRPLYQSWLLPDVALVGGLAEVAYGLQLSSTYAAFGLDQPVLVPRDSVQVIHAGAEAGLSRFGLTTDDLDQPLSDWEQKWLMTKEPPSASPWRQAVKGHADDVLAAFVKHDASLEGSVKATLAKVEKLFDKLDQQGRRAVRRASAEELEALSFLHAQVHPGGAQQERLAPMPLLAHQWAAHGAGSIQSLASALESAFMDAHESSFWSPVFIRLFQGKD